MGLDELKLIGEMLAQLGANAQEAFLWWLILDKIPSFILWAGFIGLLFFTIKKIASCCAEEIFFDEMSNHLKVSRYNRRELKEKITHSVNEFTKKGKP